MLTGKTASRTALLSLALILLAALPSITRHRAFRHAFTAGIYPNMEPGLNDALTMYAGGLGIASSQSA